MSAACVSTSSSSPNGVGALVFLLVFRLLEVPPPAASASFSAFSNIGFVRMVRGPVRFGLGGGGGATIGAATSFFSLEIMSPIVPSSSISNPSNRLSPSSLNISSRSRSSSPAIFVGVLFALVY